MAKELKTNNMKKNPVLMKATKGSSMQMNYGSPAKNVEKKMTAEEKQAASLAAAEKTEGITVSEKKYTDATNEYKTKGNKATRDHIASGGKVLRMSDGSLKLTKSTN